MDVLFKPDVAGSLQVLKVTSSGILLESVDCVHSCGRDKKKTCSEMSLHSLAVWLSVHHNTVSDAIC